MKLLLLLPILHALWQPSSSLMNTPSMASFITEYFDASELQHAYQTIMICGRKEYSLLGTLLSLKAKRRKFLLLKSSKKSNVSHWNVRNEPHGFILDMDCPNSEDILRQASDLNLLRNPYSWLLLVRDEPGNKGVDVDLALPETTPYLYGLEGLNPRLDSLVVLAIPTSSETIKLIEVYKIRQDLKTITLDYGKWKVGGHVERNKNQVMAYRRLDLNGTTVTGTIVVTKPGSMQLLHSLKEKHRDAASRLTYVLIKSMATILNAKLELVETNTWGHLLADGQWSGMIGDLLADKADVGSCPLFLSHKRMEQVDYLLGLTYTRTAFITTAPQLSYSKNLFTLPFSTTVWVASLGIVIITTFLLFLTTRFENKLNSHRQPDKEILDANLSDIAMLNLGAICQQGCDAMPRGLSGRIVTIILYLSIMFLYVSYSASIVALLQSSDTSIKTIKDLLDSPIKCGAEDIPYHREWFKAATDPVRKELYLKKIAPKGEDQGNFLTMDEGIRRVREGLYAFHVEVSPGYLLVQQTFLESEKCRLQELPSFIQVPEPWIPMKKNSPFAEHFKIGIKLVREAGIESRAMRRLYTSKPRCRQRGSNFVSVGIMDSYHMFLILAYGAILSMVILLIECAIYLRLKRRLKEISR